MLSTTTGLSIDKASVFRTAGSGPAPFAFQSALWIVLIGKIDLNYFKRNAKIRIHTITCSLVLRDVITDALHRCGHSSAS